MAAAEPPALMVRFVAFGAEPRGQGDALHHFGSQAYVRDLPAAQRAAVAAMVSLDRVGVSAPSVPLAIGGTGTTQVMDALSAASDLAGIPTARSQDNRASDHWSFEKADIPSAGWAASRIRATCSAGDMPVWSTLTSSAGSGRCGHGWGPCSWAWSGLARADEGRGTPARARQR